MIKATDRLFHEQHGTPTLGSIHALDRVIGRVNCLEDGWRILTLAT